jgi:hypothetical protein
LTSPAYQIAARSATGTVHVALYEPLERRVRPDPRCQLRFAPEVLGPLTTFDSASVDWRHLCKQPWCFKRIAAERRAAEFGTVLETVLLPQLEEPAPPAKPLGAPPVRESLGHIDEMLGALLVRFDTIEHRLDERLAKLEQRLDEQPRVVLFKPNHRRNKDGGGKVHDEVRALRRITSGR